MIPGRLRLMFPSLLVLALLCQTGCGASAAGKASKSGVPRAGVRLRPIRFDGVSEPAEQTAMGQPLSLAVARNEWAAFAFKITGLPAPRSGDVARHSYSLRLRLPSGVAT